MCLFVAHQGVQVRENDVGGEDGFGSVGVEKADRILERPEGLAQERAAGMIFRPVGGIVDAVGPAVDGQLLVLEAYDRKRRRESGRPQRLALSTVAHGPRGDSGQAGRGHGARRPLRETIEGLTRGDEDGQQSFDVASTLDVGGVFQVGLRRADDGGALAVEQRGRPEGFLGGELPDQVAQAADDPS